MIRNTLILKTISLFLSFWMLFASAGLSVDFHYCDGNIVDWNITGAELFCEHSVQKMEESSCCKASHDFVLDTDKMLQIEQGCCDTGEAELVISQDFDLNQTEIELSISVLLSASFHLNSKCSQSSTQYLGQQNDFPPIPILRKLATIQTFIL